MEEKTSKKTPAELDASEYWTAGGPLWINFSNSLTLAGKGMPDVLRSPESLEWWLTLMGLSVPLNFGVGDLAFATQLRVSISRVIQAVEQGTPIPTTELEHLNSVLRVQREWVQLNQLDTGIVVSKGYRENASIEQAFGPVTESLVQTLTHGDWSRIRTCAHPDCTLNFYDDSKNGTRRWCTMSGCGNRAKAAAFLQRKKSRE